MPYYEFCLIGGDGSRLSRERHPAADLETVWGRVFRMAELESKRGNRSMSWMTKGGSSSASGQSPLRFPLNELARRGVAPTEHECATVEALRIHSSMANGVRRTGSTTKSAEHLAGRRGRWERLRQEVVYPSEGFG